MVLPKADDAGYLESKTQRSPRDTNTDYLMDNTFPDRQLHVHLKVNSSN